MDTRKRGNLTIYVDCVSPYSWFGFTNAVRFRPSLNTYGVSVEIVPFFLGAARDSVGNPWTPAPKVKEAFGRQDTETTARLLGLTIGRPKVFPILSLQAVRVANWVRDHYTSDVFESVFDGFASGYWSKGIDISQRDGIIRVLSSIISADEVENVMTNAFSPENKKRVTDRTLSAGAWGAPWIVAVNEKGESKSWFGNDRWHQIFDHLTAPYLPVTILPPCGVSAKL